MKLTIAHLLVSIREILFDTYVESYRWSDGMLIRFIYEGIVKISAVRPESRYVNNKLIDLNIPLIATDATQEDLDEKKSVEFPIDDKWSSAVIHYACYRAFQLDEADTMNGNRANEHLNFFNTWSQL